MKFHFLAVKLIDFGVAINANAHQQADFILGTLSDLMWLTTSFARWVLFPNGEVRTKDQKDILMEAVMQLNWELMYHHKSFEI